MLEYREARRTVCRSGRNHFVALLLIATAALGGCNDDSKQPLLPGTTSSNASSLVPSTTTPPATSAAQNRAPAISGAPVMALNASSSYSFSPASSDADGDTLSFSIANKPGWATFNTVTGRLTGTPTLANVGTYANIVISVSDGKASSALGAFSIAVTQVSAGSATLSWIPPTQNTDGSQLTNLSGYRIYYGTSAAALTQTIDITNAGLASYMVENLSPATWYFAIKALAGGVESDLSSVASKTIS